jgi:pyruvate-ferredoxin/flavodoxin oxidoreductase
MAANLDPKNPKRPIKYPGLRTTADGSEAVVHVEANLCHAACAAPLPPASRMATLFQRETDAGRRNLWNEPLRYLDFNSSHSAASACEGVALAGGRVATFTSGQGLLEMAEILHSAAGKRLPIVFHVAARSLASQGLSLHAGHDEVMLVADAGCGMLFARDAQEAADLAVIARRAAELCETPFLNVQDGFLTTHTLETVRLPEPELLKVFNGPPSQRLRAIFNPREPLVSSPVQNQDSYMKGRIAQRFFYERVRPSLLTAMSDFYELTGRRYETLRQFRMDDAEFAIVGLGSMMGTVEAAAEILRGKGIAVGALSVTCFRPFPSREIVQAISRCRAVAVIERTDTPLAESNPLALEIKAALATAQMGEDARLLRIPEVFSGAAGLGGGPITPAHLIATVENMQRHGRRFFVLGIKHPEALTPVMETCALPAGAFALRCYSVAGYGASSANRLIASVAADLFHLEVRASSHHGAEERGSAMRAWLTIAPRKITSPCEPASVQMVAVETAAAFRVMDPLEGLQPGGAIYLQTELDSAQVWGSLPPPVRRTIRERNLRLYVVDALRIAREAAGETDAAARMQGLALAGVVLRVAPFRENSSVSDEDVFAAAGTVLVRLFGAAAVAPNLEVLRRAYQEVQLVEPPDLLADYEAGNASARPGITARGCGDGELVPSGFCDHILHSYAQGREDTLDADLYAARSLIPAGAAGFRSYRTLAASIPKFIASNCTGCMECVNLCPDSAIFARIVETDVVDHAPVPVRSQFAFTRKYFESALKRGETGGLFGLYIDVDRCKGCGECVQVCGGREALRMLSKSDVDLGGYDRIRDFFELLPETPARFLNDKSLGDIMLSRRSRLHAGGAGSCAGCGESSAIRMLLSATGYFYGAGEIGIVAAMGCHQAAGSTYPYTPYEVAWTNTLAANAPADAMGIRLRWDQQGFERRRLWVIGTDDALAGAGLHSLAAMIRSGMDLKVLILDKGQRAPGCDLGSMLMCYPEALVAQTTPAHVNHFYKSVIAANEFAGPAAVVCYASCMESHGVPEDQAFAQAKLAVDSRAFPIYIYDPREGNHIRERLDLRSNPAIKDDWFADPKTFEPTDFLAYARTEGRFSPHFDAGGNPDAFLMKAQQDCLLNWRRLQELAGLR